MRKNLLLVIMLLGMTAVFAQNQQPAQLNEKLNDTHFLDLSERNGTPEFFRFDEGKEVYYRDIMPWLRDVLNMRPDDELRLVKTEEDNLGMVHYRYQQYFKGVKVFGGQYFIHTKNGKVVSANGKWYDVADNALSAPGISEQAALQAALDIHGGTRYFWEIPDADKMIQKLTKDPTASFTPKGDLAWMPKYGDFNEGTYELAWVFDVWSLEPYGHDEYFMDAADGSLLFKNPKLFHTDVPGIANTKYEGNQTITVDSVSPNLFELRETTRGDGVHTRNANEGQNPFNYTEFTDSDNYWDNVNVDHDEAATDAHWGAEQYYDYLWQEHGRKSYDGNDGELISYVHWSQNLFNASWNGVFGVFGDGNNNPLTAIDVVVHEFTHGLTGNTANLVYAAEPGALNESYSDILTIPMDQFANAGSANWQIGEDVMSGGGMRNMADPNNPSNFSIPQPDTYNGTHYAPTVGPCDGSNDNCGVHINSGVSNFAFYLLCVGGNGTNDHGDAYSVSGITVDKADDIVYRALTVYLNSTSQFQDCRQAWLQSAIDIYGACSPEMQQVMNAWHAVGVGSKYSATITSGFTTDENEFCEFPVEIDFIDQSAGAIQYWWSFGDLTISSNPSPTHIYNFQGTFTVQQVVTDCAGAKDTTIKTDYIVIDASQPCNVSMPSGGTQTQESCNGTIFDSGGKNNNYKDNNFGVVTIQPTGALTVTLSFISFDMANSGDVLFVYDGPDQNAPLIGTYNGTNQPPSSITSSGGSITLVESTNGFQNFAGFEIDWACAVSRADLLDGESLGIYPNPSSGVFHLDYDFSGTKTVSLTVVNLFGQEISREAFTRSGRLATSLDLGGLAKGVYYLRLETDGRQIVRKLILD